MKGQLFISDVLASLLILTIIVGFTAWQLDQIYMRAGDVEYAKIDSIASDISQLAVRNMLANISGDNIQSNVVDITRWTLLENNMSEMIKPPYAYEANLLGLSAISSNGGCDSRQNVAVSRRIIYLSDATGTGTLIVKVCI